MRIHCTGEWRKIPGFKYEVSDLGEVRRIVPAVWATGKVPKKLGRTLKPQPHWKGYLAVELRKGGRRYYKFIHVLVARVFIGPPPNSRYQVNHTDTNKSNNRADNLEYLTPLQNVRHGRANGCWKNQARGERVNTAKLTANAVRCMRSLIAAGTPVKEIAADWKVTTSYAYKIKNRETWDHV